MTHKEKQRNYYPTLPMFGITIESNLLPCLVSGNGWQGVKISTWYEMDGLHGNDRWRRWLWRVTSCKIPTKPRLHCCMRVWEGSVCGVHSDLLQLTTAVVRTYSRLSTLTDTAGPARSRHRGGMNWDGYGDGGG